LGAKKEEERDFWCFACAPGKIQANTIPFPTLSRQTMMLISVSHGNENKRLQFGGATVFCLHFSGY